jgi:hypothetical protein
MGAGILFDIPHDFLKKYVILKSNSCRGNGVHA